ncbi:YqhR family membrane protein [Sutcliffiella halmapala]|uniref:YqhR family membrane protein n=1 Tax=Sutcliffiella halmapala TaxID=79882 RepID=UPI000994CDA0|nr:YqhR family membrane protein [Sutcliffiella halmapala]
MSENRELEQNKREQPMSFMTKVVVTGFVGGVFWSIIGYVAYLFSFTEISPNVVLQPWALGDWKKGLLGYIISFILLGVFGIGAALIYAATLKQFPHYLLGIVYGIALWGIVFFLLNPMFPAIKTIQELTFDTNITNLCLYILFGVFVGYSISFEHSEMQMQKQQQQHQDQDQSSANK